MKLQTGIPARRDGTLKVQGLNGEVYVLRMDADGVLTGEVGDEATVAHLLGTGNFYPANPEDFDAAWRLAGDGMDADGDGDGDGDIEQAVGGLPVEANSPLKPLPNAKAGGKPKK